MTIYNFDNGRTFEIDGDFDGMWADNHSVRIPYEYLDSTLAGILTEDEINDLKLKCLYEDAISVSNGFLKTIEPFRTDKELRSCWDKKSISYVLEIIEEFVEMDDKILDAYNVCMSLYPEIGIARNAEKRNKRIDNKEMEKDFGYIYIVQLENGLIKIGRTNNLEKRMYIFSVKFPMNWAIIHSIKSYDNLFAERFLHKKFSSKRNIGEWFMLSEEDVEYIKSIRDFSI